MKRDEKCQAVFSFLKNMLLVEVLINKLLFIKTVFVFILYELK